MTIKAVFGLIDLKRTKTIAIGVDIGGNLLFKSLLFCPEFLRLKPQIIFINTSLFGSVFNPGILNDQTKLP